ncbi:MAG: hypothetical protein IJQ06_05195 [Paludibacteraceae bacterium]|nr:hypothetical protein [Paludibacteraceae bacterium]MBR0064974.1 hypothetical protein [Paludibacteraceae bacterium]
MEKQYILPATEIMVVNTELMIITGEASLLPGPGTIPARFKDGKPVF